MARRKPARRIEPDFEAPQKARGRPSLAAGEDDRLVEPIRRKTGKAAAKGGAKSRVRRRGRARKSRGLGLWALARRAVYWSLVVGLWACIAVVGLVAYYGARMPSAMTWAVPDRPPNVRIVDVHGDLVANRGLMGGQAVGLNQMSPYIPEAVIAIEDRRFYSHFGIDPVGLVRAAFENLVTGHVAQGGSTLTQQLAKNLFLKPDRTLERKVQEVLLALWLERKFSKRQILEMYLNRVYFGSGAYGVEAASRRYFSKPASKVTLSEAALLAGLLKAPSRLSPARDPKAAEARAQVVLAAMRDAGMIGDGQMATAMSASPTRAASYWTGSENYFADKVMEELPDLVGEIDHDVVVHATLDMPLQKTAESAIRQTIDENGAKRHVGQGVLVAIDDSGAVRAMVGGTDYADSQFDRALEARRQPGSAFKPFVYLAALESGLTPDSVRNDAPVRIGKWSPDNYAGKYYGRVTLAEALAKSLNSVAAQLVMEVGPKTVVRTAARMGIESDLDPNVSIALGTSEVTPLELTAAYVPFANGGYRPTVHFVDEVTDPGGKVLYRRKPDKMPRVVRPDIVADMNRMMSGTIEDGTARNADFGWPAAGKTGTTQNARDAWFVGYTADITTGVWFGNDDGSPTGNVTGGSLPALAWRQFMEAAQKGLAVRQLPGTGAMVAGRALPTLTEAVPSARPDPAGAAQLAADSPPRPPVGLDRTSSIRPVPPADVGAGNRAAGTSILDILLGR